MFSRLFLATGLVIGLSVSLQAQYNPRHQMQPGRQPAVAAQPAQIQGTIEGIARGGLMVLDSNNQPYRVAVPRNAKVQVIGTATADFLQPGLIVEFKAEVDDAGALKEKVAEMTIVSLSAEKHAGLFPADSEGKAGEDKGGLGAPAERGSKPAKKKPTKHSGKGATRAIPAGSYRIVGRLTVESGKLAVQTPDGKAPLELTEEPKISVDCADCTVANQGDKITVKGIAMPARPGMMRMVQASEVKIELAEPLAGVQKKGPAAKSEAKHGAKRPKKEEGLPEPAEEKDKENAKAK
jgi:hypothetical protein